MRTLPSATLKVRCLTKAVRRKNVQTTKICYAFRTPSAYGQYLADAGFDYLSLANNHSNGFGAQGITATAGNLDELNIKYSGIENRFETAILKKNGVRYGFVSFAPNLAAVKLNDYAKFKKLIRKTKQKTDIVIVMFHGGAEGKQAEHLPFDTEIFYGENRGNVVEFARLAVDSGADVVFGQGRTSLAPSNFTATASSLTAAATLPPTASAALRRFSKLSPTNRGGSFPATLSPSLKSAIKPPKSTLKKLLLSGLFI